MYCGGMTRPGCAFTSATCARDASAAILGEGIPTTGGGGGGGGGGEAILPCMMPRDAPTGAERYMPVGYSAWERVLQRTGLSLTAGGTGLGSGVRPTTGTAPPANMEQPKIRAMDRRIIIIPLPEQ